MSTEVNISGNTTAMQTGKTYVRASRKYYRLKVFQQIATLSTSFVEMLIVGSFLLFGIVFIALSGAIALGTALNNMALGYIAVAIFFVLLAALAVLMRKKIYGIVIRKLSKTYFN